METTESKSFGVPWHLEKMHRKDDDPRRHRSRCEGYDKATKQCSKYGGVPCHGAAHCRYYRERQIKTEDLPKKMLTSNRTCITLSNGRRVRHSIYGIGRVNGVADNRFCVDFDGHTKTFAFPAAFQGNYLELLPNDEKIDEHSIPLKRPRISNEVAIGEKVFNKFYGEGNIISIDEETNKIGVRFPKGEKYYLFPNAFENGFLTKRL
jgi:hypothetical protein